MKTKTAKLPPPKLYFDGPNCPPAVKAHAEGALINWPAQKRFGRIASEQDYQLAMNSIAEARGQEKPFRTLSAQQAWDRANGPTPDLNFLWVEWERDPAPTPSWKPSHKSPWTAAPSKRRKTPRAVMEPDSLGAAVTAKLELWTRQRTRVPRFPRPRAGGWLGQSAEQRTLESTSDVWCCFPAKAKRTASITPTINISVHC